MRCTLFPILTVVNGRFLNGVVLLSKSEQYIASKLSVVKLLQAHLQAIRHCKSIPIFLYSFFNLL